ncbi:hypothetical protein FRB99_002370 [Tulasnella sp. 403]|nr:hypothetical protein FRB99_002370 [Tulasnella sp. 403]
MALHDERPSYSHDARQSSSSAITPYSYTQPLQPSSSTLIEFSSPTSTYSRNTLVDSDVDLISDESVTPPTASTPLLSKASRQQASLYSSSNSSSSVSLVDDRPRLPTPLPMKQLWILLLGQLPEPVVASVLYPFINQLIAEVGVTGGDDKKIGYYAGFIVSRVVLVVHIHVLTRGCQESLFFLAEFCMVLKWGRLSDRIGRKPVIMCGLFGLGLSSALFGLSTTYPALVFSRALAGMLSGNIGVMKSALGEITDETNIAEGFALLPVVWSAGSTLGPLIGGFLSRPADKFPTVFTGDFWRAYPYFLPCVTATAICFGAFTIIGFYLEESLPSLRAQRIFEEKEHQTLNVPRPRRPWHRRLMSSSQETLVETTPERPLREIFTPKVAMAVGNYCALALLDIAYTALLPLFYATPIEAGGLGFTPQNIGAALGTLGLINGFVQGVFSAKAQRTLGVKTVYYIGLFSYFGVFGIFPLANSIARTQGVNSTIIALMFVQLGLTICCNMSFGCICLFITAAAEKNALGSTNGIAQTAVSFIRMIGPAAATSLFAWTMEGNVMNGRFVYSL